MEDKLYWAIVCDNYHGHEEVYYFTSHEVAMKNFLAIVNNHKDADKFYRDGHSCSWYDSQYNEYSTFVTIEEKPVPKIHDDIIF